MNRLLALFATFVAMLLPNASWALQAHFSNDTGQSITIAVQDNNCVTYVPDEAQHTLEGHTPTGGWIMNLGDRNTGGCSASYMLAWGIYAGDEVDPAKKIGDINFHYQSGMSVNTWQNKTSVTKDFFPYPFFICSHSAIKQNSWDHSYVWWHFGPKYSDWDCDAPVN